MDHEKQNYKVSSLILEHSHSLHLPQTLHSMLSKKENFKITSF